MALVEVAKEVRAPLILCFTLLVLLTRIYFPKSIAEPISMQTNVYLHQHWSLLDRPAKLGSIHGSLKSNRMPRKDPKIVQSHRCSLQAEETLGELGRARTSYVTHPAVLSLLTELLCH
jgi:hypothetical protein